MADSVINNGIDYVKDTPYRGKDVWYFIQSTDPKVAPIGSPAILPAHQESGDTSIEGDSLDEQTKMGRIVAASTNEDSIDLTAYMVPGDKSTDIIIDAKHEGRQVKVWRVVVDKRLAVEEGDHKAYPAMFGYGVVDSADISDEDSFSEIDFTLNILGKLTNGTFPLSDEQVAALDALYEYERPGEKEGEFKSTSNTANKPVTGVTINQKTASMKVGDTKQLTAEVEPKDATNPAVNWKSSDDTIATVSAGGNVTAIKAGTAIITVTTVDGGFKGECAVTVANA